MIHALPGMGADRRVFPAPWSSIPSFSAHNWMPHAGERTLSEVAEAICHTAKISDGDSLIGSSLGGMVACETAKIRQIKKLYLVGSAIRKEEVNPVLQFLHPLAGIAPLEWLRFSAEKVPSNLAQMFAANEASFIRAMCSAIFAWEGLSDSFAKVYRIHGKNDLVILPPKNSDLLLDGGHLISMTHPYECADFIKKTLSE